MIQLPSGEGIPNPHITRLHGEVLSEVDGEMEMIV
jgi:hypothetical protein